MFFPGSTLIRGTTALTRQTSTFRRFCTTQILFAQVKVGDVIPSIELYKSPTEKVNILDLASEKKIILFAVSGAFAPGCSKIHLQGYINKAKDMKKEGISEIICVSVNDPYVMQAWEQRYNTKGKIQMLADPAGRFIKTLGLGMHVPTLGGFRSKRFSMVINDCLVEQLNIEPDGTGLTCSLANGIRYRHDDTSYERM